MHITALLVNVMVLIMPATCTPVSRRGTALEVRLVTPPVARPGVLPVNGPVVWAPTAPVVRPATKPCTDTLPARKTVTKPSDEPAPGPHIDGQCYLQGLNKALTDSCCDFNGGMSIVTTEADYRCRQPIYELGGLVSMKNCCFAGNSGYRDV